MGMDWDVVGDGTGDGGLRRDSLRERMRANRGVNVLKASGVRVRAVAEMM